MKIALGSDHAGYDLKAEAKDYLEKNHHTVIDFGSCDAETSVDYPDYALAVAEAVANGDCERGILVCGTGIGIAIAANKVPGIRAAVCHDLFTARVSREHNDANLLVLGGRVVDPATAREIIAAWMAAEFAGGRHARRLQKIAAIEAKYCKRRSEGGPGVGLHSAIRDAGGPGSSAGD